MKHKSNTAKVFLRLTSFWLILIFLFNPHFVELTGVLETWFPAKGLIYYKDFAAYHFPLGRLILLPLHLFSNWNLELDPFVGLAMGIGTLILIYLFGKRFLTPKGTSISLFFFAVFFWFAATGVLFFHEILIGFLIALSIYLLFDVYKKGVVIPKTAFILGLLLAFAELSGQIATLTLGAIGILLVLLAWRQKQRRMSSILALVGGTITPLVILSLYFLSKDALGEFFHYNLTYYLQYAGYQKDSLWALPIRELLAFYIPLIVLLILVGLDFLRRRTTSKNNLLILLLSISTMPFIVFSIYHPHHLNYALPIVAIAAGFAFDSLQCFSLLEKKVFSIGVAFFLFVFLTIIVPWHLSRIVFPPSLKIVNDLHQESNESVYNFVEWTGQKALNLIFSEYIAQSLFTPENQVKKPLISGNDPILSVVEWLKQNTSPETRIMVMGDSIIYFRSNRLPASRPSKSIPYGWEPTIIKNEIQEKRSEYWIVSRQFTEQLIHNNRRPDIVDFINQELDMCYKTVVTYEDWEIWQKTCE